LARILLQTGCDNLLGFTESPVCASQFNLAWCPLNLALMYQAGIDQVQVLSLGHPVVKAP